MKKSYIYIACASLLTLAGACAEEKLDGFGTGTIAVSATLSSDMEVESRASEQELRDGCEIWISSEKGLVRRYKGVDNIPATIDLVTGTYVAEAWAGDSVSASFEKKAFKAYVPFEVKPGQTTPVALDCKIANVAASVSYCDNIGNVLDDITMTVGHTRGSLVFDGLDERRGYFMMPAGETDLTYTLEGKQKDGSAFTFPGTISNVRPGVEYRLNVTYTPGENTMGGAFFTIRIDDTEMTVEQRVELVTPPDIKGYDFNIANPVVSTPGNVGEKQVYVLSGTSLKSVDLRSDFFLSEDFDIFGGNDCELIGMSQAGLAAINNAGISYTINHNEEADNTVMCIVFGSTLTDNLAEGDHSFEIVATDIKGRTTAATLLFTIGDAPVITIDPDLTAVAEHSAVLRGQINKDGVESAGFKYRATGTAEWSYTEGVAARAFAAGDEYIATVTGLRGNTTYEYVTVTDYGTPSEFISSVSKSFTTLNDQLPNSSFEEWGKTGKVEFPGLEYPAFWDSGNHGSSKMSKTVTTQSTDYAHSGTHSICLKSQFVGMGLIGKFAAGNVFAGRYLYTDGMDGELGFGQPWTLRPRQVRVWAKYVAGTVQSGKGSGSHLSAGDKDQGAIYVALVDNTLTKYDTAKSEWNGTEWPCVVKTKSGQLFDKNGANVVAYGEHIFATDTEGNGLVEIVFDLNDVNPDLEVANIIFVASASRYGDFFEGGEGSLLYLDDIELIY
ncbi:MAG: DUF4493 domain-containing protein [Muribaculaceae bacterium]|nr:DUF4493 domain-containing protein [Muribaculaceae bacterium]